MSAYVENPAVAIGLEEVSFHSKPKEGQCQRTFKLPTIVLISHASQVIHKILQLSFSSMWTKTFQMCKLGLEKVEEPEVKLPTFAGS